MALTKQQYRAFIDWNYQIYIDMFNPIADQLWFLHINSIDDAWDTVLICKQDWTFVSLPKRVFKWLPLWLNAFDFTLPSYTKCKTLSFAEKTRSIRTWTWVAVPTTTVWSKCIFTWYDIDPNHCIKVKCISDQWYHRFISPMLLERDNRDWWTMPEWFDRIMESQEEDYDLMEKELDKIADLWFIESFTFSSDTELTILFKPYRLWLWYWCFIEMPAMPIKYNLTNWSVHPWDTNYIHPHTSWWNICLWSMQDAINRNRYNFEFLCLTIYEWMCTYNRNSPYNNIASDLFCSFTRDNRCKLITPSEEMDHNYDNIYKAQREIGQSII